MGAVELPCQPPKGISQPARSAVTSSEVESGSRVVFTADLFNAFRSHCGGCHVDTSLGGFDGEKVTFENFPMLLTQAVLDDLKTDDPEKFMPPPVAGGVPWSERAAPDAILDLVGLLEAWIAAGSPSDLFFVEPETGSVEERYLMTPDQGANLTNIGNCLPDPAWFAKETEESDQLDEMFASAMELPKRLDQTDLVTWDHAELAYRGLVAFAPAYPLFSDHAGKVRHVRVPRGTSIAFDAETNEFDIPDNTRFYKTFLKKVIDRDGNESYRKIETRLIVSREDVCDGQSCEPRALFGTYAWNEAETEAVLVEDPLRNGEPFRDRILTYFTDEKAAEAAGDDAAALAAVSRHYAIPGAVRCVQCHMGSMNKSFVLGFSPVQIHRRPYVQEPDMFAPGSELVGHGVLEEDDPTEDERSQLARLIELGVVTGIDDPEAVLGLRDLGAQPARNGYELQAQGYMLGNCAGCHNPRGYPSIKHPELRPLLDFYPSKEGGGIYHFPLERTSPRVSRTRQPRDYYDNVIKVEGAERLTTPVPYISPSVYDLPTLDTPDGFYGKCTAAPYAPDGVLCIEAPWRSLIYRNVDTPFTYASDKAIFPHMPRHAPGFDCRAPRVLGSWMVSIPSQHIQYIKTPATKTTPVEYYSEPLNPLEQPRVEPGSSKARGPLEEARQRLESYQAGYRYSYCPDQTDIQDPRVLAGLSSVPEDRVGPVFPEVAFLPWMDGIPDRAHWVVLDTTDVPGDWAPRRGDWADILLGDDPDKVEALDPVEREIVDLLGQEDITVTAAFRDFALTPLPFGWWKDHESCGQELEDLPTLTTLAGDRPRWGDSFGSGYKASTYPLYFMAPGAAVFQNICRNCHGPRGNGDSALAATISEITGGGSRVANLEAGLFGPLGDPGTGRGLVFGEAAEELDVQVDDLALRYLLWMALGGTEVEIPLVALEAVDRTPVLGEPRYRADIEPSANMLNAALTLCAAALPTSGGPATYDLLTGRTSVKGQDPLIASNGDAELWMSLCAKDQRTLVRVVNRDAKLTQAGGFDGTSVERNKANDQSLFLDPTAYGSHPVATPDGLATTGVPDDASDAWCYVKPTTPEAVALSDEYLAMHPIEGGSVPYCPDGVPTMTQAEVDQWIKRGAMNAGKAVFVYLDAVAKGEIEPQIGYDECHRFVQ